MARPLRIATPGAWHHVMNRGLGRRRIFVDDADRHAFLDLLADCGRRWNVWACAFALMPNHYHLVLHDSAGRLSRAMRHLNGVYTQRFNRRHDRDGPLMRGRFRSRVVQKEGYLLEVIRYVHANPVRARLVQRAGEYPWSSHRHYLQKRPPEWLRTDEVFELIGLTSKQAGWFDAFVHERVETESARRVSGSRWSAVLGDEKFVAANRAEVRQRPGLSDREVSDGHRLAALRVDEVIAAAEETFPGSREQLLRGRRGQRNVPRLVTVLMCREHTAAPAADLAEMFSVCPASLTGLAVRARTMVKEDRAAARAWKQLRRTLAKTLQTAT